MANETVSNIEDEVKIEIFASGRRCSKCKVFKDSSEFYNRNSRPRAECKDCTNNKNKEWANNHPGYWTELHRANPERTASFAQKSYKARRANFIGWLKVNVDTRRNQCNREGVEFTITVEDVATLYNKQQGLCALTGIELAWGPDTNRGFDTLSVDRIDALGPYVLENVRLVIHWANTARQRLTDSEFVELCRAVVLNSANPTKERHDFVPEATNTASQRFKAPKEDVKPIEISLL